MRVFAVSDIHLDYPENLQWLLSLPVHEFRSDILILAGDVSDRTNLLSQCFETLADRFLKVVFVPGNHELWVGRNSSGLEQQLNSLEKYQLVCKLAHDAGIATTPYTLGNLTIVPLMAWYDFSFGEPCEKLKEVWADFRFCRWPNEMQVQDVAHYFLDQNRVNLDITNHKVISFSHFLPRIDLMPSYVPQKHHYLYPAFGSQLLEQQIRKLQPDIHVYGHSHLNTQQILDNTLYINNAFGYPSERNIASGSLVCIHEE